MDFNILCDDFNFKIDPNILHNALRQYIENLKNLGCEDVQFGGVLRWARKKGHLDIVQYLCETFGLLIEDTHPGQCLCEPFSLPIEDIRSDREYNEYNGDDWRRYFTIETVRLSDNRPLRYACEYGHLDMVQYLCKMFGLTVEDLRSCDNWALRYAYLNRHFHVIQWICEHFHLDYESEISALNEQNKV